MKRTCRAKEMSLDLRSAAEERAHALAEEEGLVLLRADNETGYKGVRTQHSYKGGTSFLARRRENGRDLHLGTFSTVWEAALCYARHMGRARSSAHAAGSCRAWMMLRGVT